MSWLPFVLGLGFLASGSLSSRPENLERVQENVLAEKRQQARQPWGIGEEAEDDVVELDIDEEWGNEEEMEDWGDMEEIEDPVEQFDPELFVEYGNDQMEEPLGGDGMNEEYDGRMYEDMRYDDEAEVNLHDSLEYEGLDDVEMDMPDHEFEMDMPQEEYDGRMYEGMRYDEAGVNLHDSTGYESSDDVEMDMPDDEFEMDTPHNDELDMMFSADNIADLSSQHNTDEGEKRQIHVMDDTDDMKVLTGENAMEHDMSLIAEKENAPAEMEKLDMAQN